MTAPRDEAGRRLYDISQPLRADLPVWPGDTPLRLEHLGAGGGLSGECLAPDPVDPLRRPC